MMKMETKLYCFIKFGGANWINEFKYSNTFNSSNNLVEYLEQYWVGSDWQNKWQYIYTYDTNNNQIESLGRLWSDSIWLNYWDDLFTYNEYNNLTEIQKLEWDGLTWINYGKRLLAYIPITTLEDYFDSGISYTLLNNYPNPFNPTTTIQYMLSSRQFVSLKIFDVLGIEIETLVNEEKPAGNYELNWNAANLPSGVYFYRMNAGDYVQTRKMILLK